MRNLTCLACFSMRASLNVDEAGRPQLIEQMFNRAPCDQQGRVLVYLGTGTVLLKHSHHGHVSAYDKQSIGGCLTEVR